MTSAPRTALMLGLASWALAVGLFIGIGLTYGERSAFVHVRWGARIDTAARNALERQYSLIPVESRDDSTWRYQLMDVSRNNIRGLVTNPAVEDTHYVHRTAYRVWRTAARGRYDSPRPAWVADLAERLMWGFAGLGALLLAGDAMGRWRRRGVSEGVQPPLSRHERLGALRRRGRGASNPRLMSAIVSCLRRGTQRDGSSARLWTASGRFRCRPDGRRTEVGGGQDSKVKPEMSDRLQAAGAAVCMAACTLAWHFLTFSGFNNDHYVHVARGYQMLLGDLPVRDFVDPGEPLMYAVSAGARALFGPALGTEWMVVAGAFAVAAAYTVTAAARLSGSVAVALLIASLQVAISPRSFAYPKILVYAAAALVFMHAAARPTHRRIVALALMTAVAFLFRHDHGLFVGFGALATTVIASYPEGPRIAARRAGLLVLWIGVVLAPWVVFVQTYAGLDSYFASAVGFWRSEMQSAELRTLPGFEVWPFDAFRNALAWLFYLFHLLPLACLALVVRRRRMSVPDRWAGETAVVAGIALMAIPVNVFLIRAGIQIDARIADAFVPAGLLGAWLLAPGAPLQRPRWSLAVMLAVAGTTIAAIATAGDVREQVGRTDAVAGWDAVQERVSEGWASLQSPLPTGSLAPSRFSLAMLPFIKYVTRCTTRQDRLLMTVLYPEVYVMADRGFAGGHQEYRPGFYTNDADQRQMMARLERQSVPFVIMVNDQAAALRTQMPRLDAFVTAHYHPLVFIPVQDTSGVDVFVDSRREVVRRDPETGWPCFVA